MDMTELCEWHDKLEQDKMKDSWYVHARNMY